MGCGRCNTVLHRYTKDIKEYVNVTAKCRGCSLPFMTLGYIGKKLKKKEMDKHIKKRIKKLKQMGYTKNDRADLW